jgi:nitrate reductase assembly molybdenum cofactor insertion protein NarJ
MSMGGMHTLSVLLLNTFNECHYQRYSLTNLIKEQQESVKMDQTSNNTMETKRYSLTSTKRSSLAKQEEYQVILRCVECIKCIVTQCGYENLFITRDFMTNLAAIVMASPFSHNYESVDQIHEDLMKSQIEILEMFHSTLTDLSLSDHDAQCALSSITTASQVYHEAMRFSHCITSLRRSILILFNHNKRSSYNTGNNMKQLLDSYVTSVLKFLDAYISLPIQHQHQQQQQQSVVAQELVNLGFLDVVKLLQLYRDQLSPMIRENLYNILHSQSFTTYQKESITKRDYIASMTDLLYTRLEDDSESYGYLVSVLQQLTFISNTDNQEFVLNNWRSIDKIINGSIVSTDEQEVLWDTVNTVSRVDEKYLHLQDTVLTLQQQMSNGDGNSLPVTPRITVIPSPRGEYTSTSMYNRSPSPTITISTSEYNEDVFVTDDNTMIDTDTVATAATTVKVLHLEEISNVNDTIFGQMSDTSDITIDQEELMKLFCGQQKPYINSNNRKLISFIDPNRSKQILYELQTIQLSNEEIKQCILDMDESKLSERHITLLSKIIPSREDVDIYIGYNGSIHNLSPVDQFFCTLKDVQNLRERIDCWLFKFNYRSNLAMLWPDIECLLKACEQLRTSQKWKELLKVVLCVANFLNSKNNTTIQGFKMNSLLKVLSINSLYIVLVLIKFL